jgi:hypothetical protein
VLIEAGAYITTPESHPLFPFDVAGYRGASVPFLAGNPLAHAVAAASCRALAPEWDRASGSAAAMMRRFAKAAPP